MSIKKLYICALCVCLAVALSLGVSAEVNLDEYAYFADDGSLQYDMDAYYYALAQDLVLHSGVEIAPFDYWLRDPNTGDFVGYDYESFRADYDAAIAALAPEPSEGELVEEISVEEVPEEDEPVEEVTSELPFESEDISISDILEIYENNMELESEEDIPHQYVVNDLRDPVVDTVGCGTISFNYDEDLDYIEDYSNFHVKISPTVLSFDEFLRGHIRIIGWDGSITEYSCSEFYNENYGFSDNGNFATVGFAIVNNPPFVVDYSGIGLGYSTYTECGLYIVNPWYSTAFNLYDVTLTIPDFYGFPYVDGGDTTVIDTLKEIVVSIFGEYTPVNTTALLTETVDNVTTTTLIDVVASGAAGVDWEWCAGVFLFGIMLFCLFKLLGGILS